MTIQRMPTARDIERIERDHRAYRASKMSRDHEIELLLGAGVSLPEALKIVDGANA